MTKEAQPERRRTPLGARVDRVVGRFAEGVIVGAWTRALGRQLTPEEVEKMGKEAIRALVVATAKWPYGDGVM